MSTPADWRRSEWRAQLLADPIVAKVAAQAGLSLAEYVERAVSALARREAREGVGGDHRDEDPEWETDPEWASLDDELFLEDEDGADEEEEDDVLDADEPASPKSGRPDASRSALAAPPSSSSPARPATGWAPRAGATKPPTKRR